MIWHQTTIELAPLPRGFHLVTNEVLAQAPDLTNCEVGLLHLFIQRGRGVLDEQLLRLRRRRHSRRRRSHRRAVRCRFFRRRPGSTSRSTSIRPGREA